MEKKEIKRWRRILALLCSFVVMMSNFHIPALEAEEVTDITITGAYMAGGMLYVREENDNLPDTLTVKQWIAKDGTASDKAYSNVRKASEEKDKDGFYEYALYDETDKILFDDGKYSISYGGKEAAVTSLLSYRVRNEECKDASGKTIKFNDYVYPVVFNNKSYDDIKFVVTGSGISPEDWPEILRTGVEETNYVDESSEKLQVAWPKKANTEQPEVYTEVPENTEPDRSLDHGDIFAIRIGSDSEKEPAKVYYWDQISKIWYEKKTDKETVDMVTVKGGTYQRGDWRDAVYAYQYNNANPINMKKRWLNILDPKFMGETATGDEAVGVTGIKKENSSAKEETSEMWIFNDDAQPVHKVMVSDFEIGKYEITMEQYYRFVKDVQIKDETAEYTIDGITYSVNEVASRLLYYKKQHIRDNGWGGGTRPAIDISWYEAVEFCNYLSRKEGLEPCYTFTNIFEGEEADGKTTVRYLEPYANSAMQKHKHTEIAKVQLVRVDCDFNKNGYRLPTESEYEYAARGGEYMDEINNGNGSLWSGMQTQNEENIQYYAWYRSNVDNPQKTGGAGNLQKDNEGGNGYTSPVGSRLPNALGIYDMTGNVWEFCWDYYNQAYFQELSTAASGSSLAIKNPAGPAYTLQQQTFLGRFPVDSVMKNTFMYTYETAADGTSTRTDAIPTDFSGKLSHTLRGGCYTNVSDFVATVNRFGPAQTYLQNCINFTNARVGFRVARTVTSDTETREKFTAYNAVFDGEEHEMVTVSGQSVNAKLSYSTSLDKETWSPYRQEVPVISKAAVGYIKVKVTEQEDGQKNSWLSDILTVRVRARDISDAEIALPEDSFYYTGNENKVSPVVTAGGIRLVEGSDYTLTGDSTTGAGIFSVVINGKGNYKGTAQKTYQVKYYETDAQAAVSESGTSDEYLITAPKGFTISFAGDDKYQSVLSVSKVGITAQTNTVEYRLKQDGTGYITDIKTAKLPVKEGTGVTPGTPPVITVKKEAPDLVPEEAQTVENKVKKVAEVPLPEGWEWDAESASKVLVQGETIEVKAVYTASDKDSYEVTEKTVRITREGCVIGKTVYTGEGEKAPTCTEAGLGHKECTICGDILMSGIVVPATGHEWKETTTENGVRVNTCIVCGETETEEETITVTDEKSQAVYKIVAFDTKNGTVKYVKPLKKSVKTAVIPDTITVNGMTYRVVSIAAGAFKNCSSLSSVTIGNYVETIGKQAFQGCKKLKKVTMGKRLVTIKQKAFYHCEKIEKVVIPSKVEKIGKRAFSGCKSLKTVNIKTTALTKKNVGSNVFQNVHKKAVVKVPEAKEKVYKKIFAKYFSKMK